MVAQPASFSRTTIFEGLQATQRLKDLGLSLEGLLEVVRRGEYARAEATDNDPVNAEGIDAYRYRVRALRELFCPHGWQKQSEGGLEKIVSADGDMSVVTRGGDSGVGVRLAHPQPNRTVGASTAKSVNGGTLLLNPDWFNVGPTARPSGEKMYMLLVHRRGDVVQAELSLPSTIQDGRVQAWLERILLPDLDLSGDEDTRVAPPDEPLDEIDVPLIRRR